MIRGQHVVFAPGDRVDPGDLYRVEGPQQAICFPVGRDGHGSAHVALNLVDTHPDLLRSMVAAAYREWLA